MTDHHAAPSRRRFLRTGAAAALGLAAAPSLRGADEKTDPFGGFKLGAQSYTFRKFNTEQALKRIKGVGLRYVEFYPGHAPLTSTPGQVRALLSLCKEYQVTVTDEERRRIEAQGWAAEPDFQGVPLFTTHGPPWRATIRRGGGTV